MTNEEMKRLADLKALIKDIKYDGESGEISVSGKVVGHWNEDSCADNPEDLIWGRNISALFIEGVRAGWAARDATILSLREEIDLLRSQVATMREVLTSIASEHHPRHAEESHWLNLEHASCATVLAHDTTIAREALQSLDKKEGTK